ncbi:MAG: transposase, partial [Gammaproteobacteria bacterium]|nr:transposase [Gammaproteobacteria bacterium]
LPVPKHLNKEQTQANQYGAIELNAVYAYDGEQEWILLTSLPIENQEQLQEVISIYQSRWHIEDYHKVLKTGYQVDEIYLHSRFCAPN